MSLIDEYDFSAGAGKGGDGVVRWRREKFLPKGGPSGGNGGKGGDIRLRGTRDSTVLRQIVHRHEYFAQDGEPGSSSSKTGADAPHLYIDVPIGSIVTNTETGEQFEILEEQKEYTVLRGGIGGLGNEHFKSSTNQQPMQATKGKSGEKGNFHIELRLIADVGLVGLPNAGKTSLLNALTNADAKVGSYPFTTLDPNLGVYFGYVIADIPGLIEGASSGKGLGHKFLRHISRTRVLFHCISLERDDVVEDYDTVERELGAYEPLQSISRYVILTKRDITSEDHADEVKELLMTERGVHVLATITVLDDNDVKEFGDMLVNLLKAQAD
jgi:GTPase